MLEQNNGGALYNLGHIRVEIEESNFTGNSAVSENVFVSLVPRYFTANN